MRLAWPGRLRPGNILAKEITAVYIVAAAREEKHLASPWQSKKVKALYLRSFAFICGSLFPLRYFFLASAENMNNRSLNTSNRGTMAFKRRKPLCRQIPGAS